MKRLFPVLLLLCALACGCTHVQLLMARNGLSHLSAADWNNLGITYYRGEKVRQDYEKALECWTRGAQMGNAAAQHNLAVLYENGLGCPQDYKRARELYEDSASNGNVDAMNALANMYARGLGVPANQRKAAQYWQQAANLGSATAKENLARLAMLSNRKGRGRQAKSGQSAKASRAQSDKELATTAKKLDTTLKNWMEETGGEAAQKTGKTGSARPEQPAVSGEQSGSILKEDLAEITRELEGLKK